MSLPHSFFMGKGGGSFDWGVAVSASIQEVSGSPAVVFTSTIGPVNFSVFDSTGTNSTLVLNNAETATMYYDCRDTASLNFWTFISANPQQVLGVGLDGSVGYNSGLYFDYRINNTAVSVNYSESYDEVFDDTVTTEVNVSSLSLPSSVTQFGGVCIGAGGAGSGATSSGGAGGSGQVEWSILKDTPITSYRLRSGARTANRKRWTGGSDGYRKGGRSGIEVNGTTQVLAAPGYVGTYSSVRSNVLQYSNIPEKLETYGGKISESGQGNLIRQDGNRQFYFGPFGYSGSGGYGGTGFGAGGGGQRRESSWGGSGTGGGGAGGWKFPLSTSLYSVAEQGEYNNVGDGGRGATGLAVALLVLE
jgi:hypothetical protein